MRIRTLQAITFTLFALPALAAEVAPPPRAVPAHVTKVYCVEELVVPSPSLTGEKANAAYRKNVEELRKLVIGMVRPCTWEGHGGQGTVEFFDIGCALVVTNSPEAVNEVSDLLESLRRLQEVNVCFEVRILKMPVGFSGRIGLGLNGDVIQAETQLGRLLEEIQKHRDVSIMQSPKVTTFSGQVATVRICEKHDFVTGGELMKVQGQTVFVPKVKSIELGDAFTMNGRVSPDGKSVNVEVDVTRTMLSGSVEQFPLTTRITPVFEGGSQGTPIPFTQFLQLPDVKTQRARKAALIPTGATLIVGGWKETEELKSDQAVRGKRLFKKERPTTAEYEVMVLATVRVLPAEKPVQNIAPSPRVGTTPAATPTNRPDPKPLSRY